MTPNAEIAELRLALAPIARDPGKVIHQCETPPDEAIEQRRLADVGPSDNGDGEAHDRRPYVVHAAMSGGCDERNQRVGGGSGQATPPPEGCGDPGQAPLAAGRCCAWLADQAIGPGTAAAIAPGLAAAPGPRTAGR